MKREWRSGWVGDGEVLFSILGDERPWLSPVSVIRAVRASGERSNQIFDLIDAATKL